MSDDRVQSFESLEEMFTAMDEAERTANEKMLPEQAALRDADDQDAWWVRGDMEFFIFGVAWGGPTRRAQSLERVPPFDPEADEAHREARQLVYDEVQREIADYDVLRRRGYLYGPAFSQVTPTGEEGDTHVTRVMPITEAAFLEAKAAGWQPVVRIEGDAGGYPPATPTLVGELMAIELRVKGL